MFVVASAWLMIEKEGMTHKVRERLGMTSRAERFSVDLVTAGLAAVVAKSAAAPIERVKLLLQNQGELLKRGLLKKPYRGVGDCFGRVFEEEGLLAFWRGNQANVIRYFPTQLAMHLSEPASRGEVHTTLTAFPNPEICLNCNVQVATLSSTLASVNIITFNVK
ncbi:hypothetical protein U1Q18_051031 [Sarracenia purpurea var. burkii]